MGRKRFFAIVAALIMALCAVAFAACSDKEEPAPEVPTYTVTYYANGGQFSGGATRHTESVAQGSCAQGSVIPTNSAADGFLGWGTSASSKTPVDLSARPVTGDVSYYAVWNIPAPTQYTVTFYYNNTDAPNGGVYKTETVNAGAVVAKPADPTRSGWDFKGWYKEAACTTAYDFTAKVNAKTDIYAKWEKASEPVQKYDITFKYNYVGAPDDGVYKSEKTEQGKAVAKPADPTRSNYTFGGWYKEAACTTAYDFTAKVTANADVYAKWIPNLTGFTVLGTPVTPQYVGDTFDTRGLTYKATYADGSTKDVNASEVTYAATEAAMMNASGKLLKSGELYVVFTYKGLHPDFNIHVTVKEPTADVDDGEYLLGTFNSDKPRAEYKAMTIVNGAVTTYKVGGLTGITLASGDEFVFSRYTNNTGTPHSAAGTTISVLPSAAMTVTATGGKYKITAINSDFATAKWIVKRAVESGSSDKLTVELVGYNTLRDPANAGNVITAADSYSSGRAYLSGNFTDNFKASQAWSAPIASGKATFTGVYLKKYDRFKVVVGGSTPVWYGIAVTRGAAMQRNAARALVASYTLSSSGDNMELNDIEDGYYDIEVNVSGATGGLTINDHTETVKFNANNSHYTGTIADAQTDRTGKVTAPAAPELKGFEFVGWYKEPACSSAWNFDADVATQTTTLYAKWNAVQYTVTYSNVDTALNSDTYTATDGAFNTFALTKTGAKAHYVFAKWQLGGVDKDYLTYADLPATGTTIALTARYTGELHDISYENEDGTPFTDWAQDYTAPAKHEYGKALALPGNADVNAAGKVLIGWYVLGDTSKTVVTSVAANNTESKVYVAKFAADAVTVTLDHNYEGKPSVTTFPAERGSTITEPITPQRTGWTFNGWYKEASCTTPWVFNTDTVDADTTLFADWTRNAKVLQSIIIDHSEVKKSYVDGQKFDPSALVVKAHYDYGEDVTLDDTQYSLSIAKNTVLRYADGATRKVIVTYDGKTADFNITVTQKEISSLTYTGATGTSYYTGDTFDPTGLTFTVTYNDGTEDHPDASDITYTAVGLDAVTGKFNATGTIQITASYNGTAAAAKISVTVTQLTVESLAVTGTLANDEYNVNDTFDPTGLTFTATYNSTRTEEIAPSRLTFTADGLLSNLKFNKAGDISITVSFGGKAAPTPINVKVYTPNTLVYESWYLLGSFNSWGTAENTAAYVMTANSDETEFVSNYITLAKDNEFKLAQYINKNAAGQARFGNYKDATSVKTDPEDTLLGATVLSNNNVKIGTPAAGVASRTWEVAYYVGSNSVKVVITLDHMDLRDPATGEHSNTMQVNEEPDADVYITGNFTNNFKMYDEWSDKNTDMVYTRTVGEGQSARKVYYFMDMPLKKYDSFKLYLPASDSWLGGSFGSLGTQFDVSSANDGRIYFGDKITDGTYNIVYDAAGKLTVYSSKTLTVEVGSVYEGSVPAKSALTVKSDGTAISDYELIAGAAVAGVGASSLTVIHNGTARTVNYTAVALAITGISVTGQPNDKNYYVGESFNAHGLEITATYNDGSHKTLTSDKYIVSDDMSAKSAAVAALADKFGSVDVAVTVTLVADSTKTCQVTGVKLYNEPTSLTVVQNKTYFEGESAQKTDFTVTVNFNGGTEVKQVVTDFTWNHNKALVAGDNIVKFEHSDLEADITIPATKIAPASVRFEAKQAGTLTFRSGNLFAPIVKGQYDFYVTYNNSADEVKLTDSTKLTFESALLNADRTFKAVSELTEGVQITVKYTDKGVTVTAAAAIVVNVDLPGDMEFNVIYKSGLISTYAVTGLPESGTVMAADPAIARPADPTAKGFTFVNWVDDDDQAIVWPLDVRDNVNITAVWKAVEYNVVYELGGGSHSGNPAKYTATDNVFIARTLADAGNKAYHSFIGWHDNPQDVAGGAHVTALNYDMLPATGSTITLYAYWEEIEYVLTYDLGDHGKINGSTTRRFTISEFNANKTLIPASDVIILDEGYKFLGWYTARENGDKYGAALTTDDLPTASATFTVYALYSNSYKVTFDVNGGTLAAGSSAEVTVTYGTAVAKPADPTRTGNTFKDWHLGEATTPYDFTTPVTADITLKAHWIGNPKGGTYLRGTMNDWGEGDAYLAEYDSQKDEYMVSGVPLKLNDVFQLATYDADGNRTAYFQATQANIASYCKPVGFVKIEAVFDHDSVYNYKVTQYDTALSGRTWRMYISHTMTSIELEPSNVTRDPNGNRVDNPVVVDDADATAGIYIRGGFTAPDYGMTAQWSSDSAVMPVALESGKYYFGNVVLNNFEQFKLYTPADGKWYGGAFKGLSDTVDNSITLSSEGGTQNVILYNITDGGRYDIVFDTATKKLSIYTHKTLDVTRNAQKPVYVGRQPAAENFNVEYDGDTVTSGIKVVGAAAEEGSNAAWVICGNTVAKVTYTATSVVAQSISVTTDPTKTAYNVGDSFDKTGMVVTVTYNDPNKTTVLTAADITVAALPAYANVVNNLTDAEAVSLRVTAVIGGNTFETSVNVTLKNVLTGIEATSNKSVYYQGNALDMTVNAVFNDGIGTRRTQRLSAGDGTTGYSVTGIDMTAAGDQTANVAYLTYSKPVAITVTMLVPTGAEVDAAGAKTEYALGEAIDLAGLVLTVTYNDPYKTTVLSGADITAARLSYAAGVYDNRFIKSGTHTVTVTYTEAGKTVTDKFTVTVGSFTVSFNSKGGSAVTSMTVSDYAGTIAAPAAPEKAHYTFDGWYSDELLTTAFVFAATGVTDATEVTGSITLYAKWTPENYTVAFNSKGGSAVNSQTVEYLHYAAAPSPNPTKDHYTFAGWFTQETPADTDTPFNFAGTQITEDITLYAKWSQKTVYDVVFQTDGGTEVPTQRIEDGSVATEPTTTKTGFSFVEWQLNGAKFNFATPITARTTLTAVWTRNSYKLTFKADGAVVKEVAKVAYDANVDASLKPADPTKTGYSFLYWYYMDGAVETTWNFTTGKMPAGDLELIAKFDVNSYTLTFINDGTQVSSESVKYGAAISAPAEGEKTGYHFVYWYRMVGETETEWNFDTADTMPAYDLTLYAKWVINTYSVTFNANAGGDTVTTMPVNKTGVQHGSAISIQNAAKREGYDLTGWYTEADAAKQTDATKWVFGTTPVVKDTVLYAGWKKKTYSVSFDVNAPATVQNAPQIAAVTVEHGASALAQKPADPEILGYDFGGWYTTSELTATYDFSSAVTAAVTVYAKWTVHVYTVEYALGDGANGAGNPATFTIESADKTLADATISTAGWYFVGWYATNDPADTDAVTAITAAMIDSATVTIKLYARYDNHYNVVFTTDDGTLSGGGKTKTVSVVYNTAVTQPADPTFTGNTFKGWYLVGTGGTLAATAFDFDTPITGNITLKAQWFGNPKNGTFVRGTMNDWGEGTAYEAVADGYDGSGDPQYRITGIPLAKDDEFQLATFDAAGAIKGYIKPASGTLTFDVRPVGKVTITTKADSYGGYNYYVSAYDTSLAGKKWTVIVSSNMVSIRLDGTADSRLPNGTTVETPDVTTTFTNEVYLLGDFTDNFKLMNAWSSGSTVVPVAKQGGKYYFSNVWFNAYDQFKVFVPNETGSEPDDKWNEHGTWYGGTFALGTAITLSSSGAPNIYINHAAGYFDLVFDSAAHTLLICEHKDIVATVKADKPVYVGYAPTEQNFTVTYGTAAATDFAVTGATAVAGNNTALIVCGNTVARVTYAATAVAARSLAVTTAPTKTAYYVGESFSKAGMKVTVTNNDGTTRELADGDYTIVNDVPSTAVGTASDRLTAVEHQITIRYSATVSCTYTITVANRVTGLAVTTKPTKLSYVQHNTIDYTGMVVTLTFNDDDAVTQVVGAELYNVSPASGAELSTVGTTEVTVTLKADSGIGDSFDVTVAAPTIVSVAVSGTPTKSVYRIGDAFEPAGLVFTATYDNGRTDNSIAATDAQLTFDSASFNAAKLFKNKGVSGTVTLTAKYGDMDVTGSISVTVGDRLTSIVIAELPAYPTTAGHAASWVAGDKFNTSAMVVSARYNYGIDGVDDSDKRTEASVTGFTTSIANGATLEQGTHTVTVTYNGMTADFSITVIARAVTAVSVSGTLTKQNYKVGDEFSHGGLTFNASYNDGTTGTIASSEMTYASAAFNTDKKFKTAGNNIAITAKYDSIDVTGSITVNVSNLLTSIVVTTSPAYSTAAGHASSWVVGETLTLDGLVITLHYNKDIEGAADAPETVAYAAGSGIACTNVGATLAAGANTFSVTYQGFTAEFTITPVAKAAVGFTVSGTPAKQNTLGTFNANGLTFTVAWNDATTSAATGVTYTSDWFETDTDHFAMSSSGTGREVVAHYVQGGNEFKQTITVEVLNTTSFTVSFDGHLPEYIQTGHPTVAIAGLPDPATAKYGDKIARPADPTLIGYTFDDWYTSAACTAKYDFDAIVTGNLTIHAKWIAKTYVIRFEGSSLTTATYTATNNVFGTLAISAVTKEHYSYSGWYVDSEYTTTRYDAITYDTIRLAHVRSAVGAENTIRLYVKWTPDVYNVTFNYDDDGATSNDIVPVTYDPVSGKVASRTPADRTGKVFGGWYLNGELYDFNTIVTGPITLIARWDDATFTVKFINGDTTVSEQIITYNHRATRPADPEKASTNTETFSFAGWYTDEECTAGHEYAFGDVTENVTLYAKFDPATRYYTVSFNSKGGSAVTAATTTYQGTVARPTDPTLTGYTFLGWYTDEDRTAGHEYAFTTRVTESFTLYAKWQLNSYDVTFDVTTDLPAGESVGAIAKQTVDHGGKATRPTDPDITGYTFLGWYVGENAYNFNTAVTGEVELVAKWQIVTYTLAYNVGEHGSAISSTTFTVLTMAGVTLPATVTVTTTGYRFVGWYDGANAEATAFTLSKSMLETLTGTTVTAYAHYSDMWTVTFDTNIPAGVTGSVTNAPQPVQVRYNTAAAALAAVPQLTGYVLSGWNTAADGTGTAFVPGEGGTAVTADITVYAQWQAVPPSEGVYLLGTFNNWSMANVDIANYKATVSKENNEDKFVIHGVRLAKDYTMKFVKYEEGKGLSWQEPYGRTIYGVNGVLSVVIDTNNNNNIKVSSYTKVTDYDTFTIVWGKNTSDTYYISFTLDARSPANDGAAVTTVGTPTAAVYIRGTMSDGWSGFSPEWSSDSTLIDVAHVAYTVNEGGASGEVSYDKYYFQNVYLTSKDEFKLYVPALDRWVGASRLLTSDTANVGQSAGGSDPNLKVASNGYYNIVLRKNNNAIVIYEAKPITVSFKPGMTPVVGQTPTASSINVVHNNALVNITDSGSDSSKLIAGPAVSGEGASSLTVIYNGTVKVFEYTAIEKAVASAQIVTEPTAKTYWVGESVSLAGLVLKLTYNDGDEQTYAFADDTAGHITCEYAALTAAGSKTVTVKYDGITAGTYDVTASDKLTALVIAPTSLSFVQDGVQPDLKTRLTTVNAVFNGNVAGSEKTVAVTDLTKLTFSALDMSSATVQNVTVSYTVDGVTATANIAVTVVAKQIASITMTGAPTKSTYDIGEEFAPAGLTFTVAYDNGNAADRGTIAASDAGLKFAGKDVTAFNASGKFIVSGQVVLGATYEISGRTIAVTNTVTVNVRDLLTSVSVARKTGTGMLQFSQDTLGLDIRDHITVTATYNAGVTGATVRSETVTTYTVTGFNKSTLGEQTVTVSYEGKTDTITVKVVEPKVVRVAASDTCSKTSYLVGDEINLNGLKFTATLDNGLTTDVATTDTKITVECATGFNNTKQFKVAGSHTVTVKYDGTAFTTVDVTVANKLTSISIKTEPAVPTNTGHTTDSWVAGDAFAYNGLTITANYNNGIGGATEVNVDKTTGFSTSPAAGATLALGDNVITVSYTEGGITKTTTFTITTIAKALDRIEVAGTPVEQFLRGSFVKTGLTFTAHYNDGSVVDITNDSGLTFSSTAFDSDNAYKYYGTQTVVARFGDKTVDVEVSVTNNEQYTVGFVANNPQGTVTGMPGSQSVLFDGTATDPTPVVDGAYTNAPVLTGYTFGGWYTTAACDTAYDFATPVTGNKSIYAKWTAKSYTVTYVNYDKASESYTVGAGGTFGSLTVADVSKAHYSFGGWYYESAFTGTRVTEITYASLANANASNVITLYAKLTPDRYTLTFNGNGGQVKSESQSVTYTEAEGLPTAKYTKPVDPERAGYTFDGKWYTTSACETEYDFNTPVTGNLTLYAGWTANDVEVKLYRNDGTTTYTTMTVTCESAAAALVIADPAAREGYTFLGWFKKDGTDNDWGGDRVYSLSFTGGIINCAAFYAKWQIKTYTVSFDISEYKPTGTAALASIASITDIEHGTAVGVANKPAANKTELTGYTFLGWFEADSDTAYAFTEAVTGNTVLYAKWQIKSYDVTFDVTTNKPAGATVSAIAKQTVNHGGTATAPAVPAITGYDFDGWFVDGGSTEYKFTETMTGAVSLVAKWTIKSYTVTFVKGDNGTSSGYTDDTLTYKVTDGTVTLTNATAASGWRSLGWYTGDGTDDEWGNNVTTIDIDFFGTGANVNLYARYELDTVTVTFKDGETTLKTVTVSYNTAVSESDVPAPTKLRYTLSGWNKGDTAFALTTAITEDTILTANWKARNYETGYYVDDTKVASLTTGGSGNDEYVGLGIVVKAGQIVSVRKTEGSADSGWISFTSVNGYSGHGFTKNGSDGAKAGSTDGAYNFYAKKDGSQLWVGALTSGRPYVAANLADGDGVYVGGTINKPFVLNLGSYNDVMATGVKVGTGTETTKYTVTLKFRSANASITSVETADGIPYSLSSNTLTLYAGTYDFYYTYATNKDGKSAGRLYIGGTSTGNPNSSLTYGSAGTNNAAFITGNIKMQGNTSFDWDNGYQMTSSGYGYTIRVYLTKGDVVKVRINYNNSGTGIGYNKIQGTKPSQVADDGSNNHNIKINESGYYSFKAEWSDNPQQITTLTYSAT